jgi:hypothetical protein
VDGTAHVGGDVAGVLRAARGSGSVKSPRTCVARRPARRASARASGVRARHRTGPRARAAPELAQQIVRLLIHHRPQFIPAGAQRRDPAWDGKWYFPRLAFGAVMGLLAPGRKSVQKCSS